MVKDTEDFHHKMSLFFNGVLALPLAAFVYLFLEYKHDGMKPVVLNVGLLRIVTYSLVLASCLLVYWAWRRLNLQLQGLNKESPLKERLNRYYEWSKFFYLTVGASSALIVVGYYLTNGAIFIVLYVFLLFLLSLNRPSPGKYVRDLKLTGEEKEIILKKKAI